MTLSVAEADDENPVPAAPFCGKTPPLSEDCRFNVEEDDEVVDSCLGKVKDLAGVVRGPVRLFQIWRLTCRGK